MLVTGISATPYAPRYGGFDQSLTMLAGLPRTVLMEWQQQLQQALLTTSIGAKPMSLSYSSNDASKRVDYALTTPAQVEALLMLVNRCLGYGNARRPMRPFFV